MRLANMSPMSNSQAEICHNSEEIKVIDIAETSAGIQQDLRNTEYFPTKIKNHQSVRIVDRILKTCVYHGKGIQLRKFCRRWFGMEDLDKYGRPRYTEKLILAMESEHGYREKCINLIARVLKVKPNTVHRWGKGVEFDKIPPDKRDQYEMYLGYVDSLRIITLNLAGLNEDFLLELLRCLEFK
jgi:hypothetical protein